jgi:hypothetical protein
MGVNIIHTSKNFIGQTGSIKIVNITGFRIEEIENVQECIPILINAIPGRQVHKR